MSDLNPATNGQAEEVTHVTSGNYPFDAAEWNVPVSLGDGVTTTHVLRKPTLKDHLDREESIKRVSRSVGKNEFVTDRNETEANVNFYDTLVIKAIGEAPNPVHDDQPGSPKTISQEFEREGEEGCLTFTQEKKNQAIEMAFMSHFEVEKKADSPFAALFEQKEAVVVRQEVGGKGSDFVIRYFFTPPTPKQRRAFGRSVQITEKFEKQNSRSLKTSLNLDKGVQLFKDNLVKIEGGMVDGEEFSEEAKLKFIAAVDAMFQYRAVDTLVASYDSRD